MATLLERMNAERAGRREAARLDTRDRLRHALAELLPRGSEVWVFGSVLKPDRFRDDSDVDIAVECLPEGACRPGESTRDRAARENRA